MTSRDHSNRPRALFGMDTGETYPVEEVLRVRSFPQLRGGFREASLKVLEEVLADIPCPEHDRCAEIELIDEERVRVRACCGVLVERILREIEGVGRS